MAEDIPEPDEIYCPHCGEVTPKGGAVCGHCGGPLHGDAQKRTSPATWESRGKWAAGLAYVLSPTLFAPVAIYCGIQLRRYDQPAGERIMGAAFGSVVFWMLIFQLVL